MDNLAFQRKWIDASQQKEPSAYATHFNDRCNVLIGCQSLSTWTTLARDTNRNSK